MRHRLPRVERPTPFGGSGTLILAAHRTGRRARVIELDPKYVDVAIKRWLKVTKLPAILEETGENFKDVAGRRSVEQADAPEGDYR